MNIYMIDVVNDIIVVEYCSLKKIELDNNNRYKMYQRDEKKQNHRRYKSI